MNFLTPASDRSSSGLSFSGASACCALCSSALAAFAITLLQAAPGLPLGHQGPGELLNGVIPRKPLRHPDGSGETGFPAAGSAAGRKPASRKRVYRAYRSCCPSSSGRHRHTQLWLSFLPYVLRYLVTHEAVHLVILKSFVKDKKIQVVGCIYQ